MSIQLRPYQESASGAIRASFQAGHNAPLLVSPCGSGKTVLFSYISQKAGERGNNTLILVHRQELLRQASRTLSTFDVDHGLIAPGMTFTRQPVQVASVQTLVRRMHMLRWKPDLIVVDEAHHALGKTHGARFSRITRTPKYLA
ncbi:MAG TPA: DEAD/DEAH box helicase family protein [Gammaproteobacteria bacterium]|nr:DEAD/DEAH box helicase family protein [Gammaproteobacteria bacterium]